VSGHSFVNHYLPCVQAVAHLLPVVSHLLLEALFTESSCGELLLSPPFSGGGTCLPSTIASFVYQKVTWRAALCPSPFLQWRGLHAGYYCRLGLLKVLMESSSLLHPPSPMSLDHPAPSAVCDFQFIIYYSVFFCVAGVNLSRGLCWFIPGVAVGVPCAAYLLSCWSASTKQVWNWHLAVQDHSWFLSVIWHREALCRLGVQGVEVLLLLGVFFFCQVWLQLLSKILLYGVHTICFLPVVTILDPP
jgi:hypothetical protein